MALPIRAAAPDTPRPVVWTFNRLDKIGGVTPHVAALQSRFTVIADTPRTSAVT